jgi:type VI secretion system secreted protein Hcp
MATDIFLKVDGIDGEAADVNHPGEIEVASWSWGVSQVFISSLGGGIVGGTPKVGNILVTKQIDRASPILLRACLELTHIAQAVLTQRRAGAGKQDFLSVTLQDVLISSLNDVDDGLAPKPKETIVFVFSRVIYEYIPQKPSGLPDTPVALKWDVQANAEF